MATFRGRWLFFVKQVLGMNIHLLRGTLASALLALLLACSPAPELATIPQTTNEAVESSTTSAQTQQQETARINAWFEEKNAERLAFSPLELTSLGRKELYDQVDQMSPQAVREQLDWHAASIAEMRAEFDYELLDFEAKTSYDLWIYVHEQNLANFEFADHEYIFEQMDGAHAGLPTFLLNYHRVETLADMEAYISRIQGISRALGQQLDWAQNNAERGVRPPRFAYEMVINESRSLLQGAPFTEGEEDAALWADAQSKIDALLAEQLINAEQAEDLRARFTAALLDSFQSAYTNLITWMEQDIANSDADAQGVHALPNGLDYYQTMLASYTTTSLTAAEIHQIGLDEVDRLMAEMETIKENVGFDGSMQEFFRFLNSDDQFYYPDTPEGRLSFLDASTAYIDNMKEMLPDYFGILPQADLVVKRVEAFREQDGAPAHYYPSSPDGSIPGVYYAHLSDMNANPIPEMESTAYHEGLPGHHMQIAIALELDSVPSFRGQFFFNAYVEGWGLYAEQLAYEMGAYEDPYSNFGRLSNEMWRAVRLVVDTGLHAMGWSEQQAIDFFAQNTMTPLPSIVAEIRRYLVIPGQATSYKIGMLKILELRERTMAELGEQFDIRDFHDVILGGGALPLDILDRRVENYIAMTQASQ